MIGVKIFIKSIGKGNEYQHNQIEKKKKDKREKEKEMKKVGKKSYLKKEQINYNKEKGKCLIKKK